MTICPIAIAVGCKRCPVFTICPAKEIIGDYKKDPVKIEEKKSSQTKGKKK